MQPHMYDGEVADSTSVRTYLEEGTGRIFLADN